MKKKARKSNLPLILAIAVVAILLIAVKISLQSPQERANISVVNNATGSVNLTLSPATATIEPNQEKVITLTAESTSPMTGVEADITYTDGCGTPDVTQGNFFSNVAMTATQTNGHLRFAYTISGNPQGITGSGTVATIKIKPTSAGTCTLAITPNTLATTIENSEGNDLKTANDAVITIAQASATATATATATGTATASPTQAPASLLPSQITTLRSTSATCNTLSFSWDKITSASGYVIELDDATNFDGRLTSNNLTSDKDSYTFSNLTNGKEYYARVSQTNIHDYPRFTTIGPIKTLQTCPGAVVTPKPTIKPTVKPTLKPSIKPSPTPSLKPLQSLEPTAFGDDRFDNVEMQQESSKVDKPTSLFARFIAWLVSIFE